MNYVLHDYLNDFVVVYLDDILVCSDTFDEHIPYKKFIYGIDTFCIRFVYVFNNIII